MAMFPFTDKMFNPFSRENPFIALMPGMEPLHKVTETMMEGAVDTGATPTDGFKSMTVDYNAFGANAETMMRSMPGFENWPNLAAHPMGAAAAGSAMAMGMASQMAGVMVGTMTGMMSSAARVTEAAKEAGLPSAGEFAAAGPVKFEWAFAAAPAPKAKPVKKATPKPAAKKAEVIDLAVEKAPAKPKAAPKQAAKPKLKAAPAATAKKAEPAKAAARPAPKAAKKTTVAKKTPAAEAVALKKVSNAPAIDDVPARPGAGTAKAVAPGDFTQPVKIEKPKKPDDLKQISGVGPKLEDVLNKLGIWQFDQIAKFSPKEVAWLDDHLQFKGRIERDDWIGQAASLAEKAG